MSKSHANVPTETPAPVRHWTNQAGQYQRNRHSECMGVEFCAMPHQSALGKVGNRLALVADILTAGPERENGGRDTFKRWGARVELCHPDGRTTMIAGVMYPPREELRDATDADRDAAFRWAAEQLTANALPTRH